MNKIVMIFWKIFFLTIVSIGSLFAQYPMQGPGPGAERIEQFKKIRLMEVLQMDEETSLKFFARYNKHQSEMRELELKRNSLVDQLELMRKRDIAEGEFQKVIRELRGIGADAHQSRERYLDDISKQLTPKQFTDYIVFEQRFLVNLREMLRDLQRERMQQRRLR